MSHAAKFPTTPYDSDIVFKPSDIPADLRELVNQGSQIARKRHPDYPAGIWYDNVKVHAIRCALTADNLELPKGLESIRPPLVRTLWIHDLPEVVTSIDVGFDTSAVVKEDEPETAAKIDKTEKEAAIHILKPRDYSLFDQFEQGKQLLAGKVSHPDPTIHPSAYGARIIDIGDAEMCFYHFLTAWLIDDSFDGRLPTDRPYRFTMNRYDTFLTNCDKLSAVLEPKLLELYKNLLRNQVRFIISRWALVEQIRPDRMPSIANEHASYLQSLLTNQGSKDPR